MALSPEFREFLLDHFAGIGPIEVKRMFGGAGIYLEDACFAIVLDEQIMMRSDAELDQEYSDAGSEQWRYTHKSRGEVIMPYWSLPDSALDDPDEAVAWASKSLRPARDSAQKKRLAKARKAARNTR